MTMWLPRRLASRKPRCCSIRQVSRPERTRSLPIRGLELRHEDVFPPAFLHLSWIGRLDEKRDGLLQVVQGIFDRDALAGNVQLRAQSHLQVALPLDDRGEYRTGRGIHCTDSLTPSSCCFPCHPQDTGWPGHSSAARCAVAALSTQSASSHVTPLRPGTLRVGPGRYSAHALGP